MFPYFHSLEAYAPEEEKSLWTYLQFFLLFTTLKLLEMQPFHFSISSRRLPTQGSKIKTPGICEQKRCYGINLTRSGAP